MPSCDAAGAGEYIGEQANAVDGAHLTSSEVPRAGLRQVAPTA
jgi:hypothetical protein